MDSTDDSAVWVQKGATLSDKTAQKEFGLREEDIIEAIKAGKLQYRHNTLYGNPASIMASATPFCFWTTQKYPTVERSRRSTTLTIILRGRKWPTR